MKGVLSVNDSDTRYVLQVFIRFYFIRGFQIFTTVLSASIEVTLFTCFLQGVHSILDGCPGKAWGPDEKRINKLVFIGRNLDETALRKGFNGCIV